MSTYPPQQLLDMWEKSKLPVEQAIGYMLQNLNDLAQRTKDLEIRVRTLEQNADVDG